MLYSLLRKNRTLYILLHVEQVYQNFNRFDFKLGFFTTEVTQDTVKRLGTELINKALDCNKIVIDCYGIEEAHNVSEEFHKLVKLLLENSKSVSIIRLKNSLYKKLECSKLKMDHEFNEHIDRKDSIFSLFKEKTYRYTNIDWDTFFIDTYRNELLYNKIKNEYCQPNSLPFSSSSNVILPKYINIKKFIEDKQISFLGIYLLCKQVVDQGIIPVYNKYSNLDSRPTIFFQSIIGSYLASIFSKLAITDICYLDHIGPISKIYKTVNDHNFKKYHQYVLISDVICMGTEIQIAKNIIHHEHSEVIGIVSIVEIEVTDKNKNLVFSLFKLTSDNNKEIGYEINTNFTHNE